MQALCDVRFVFSSVHPYTLSMLPSDICWNVDFSWNSTILLYISYYDAENAAFRCRPRRNRLDRSDLVRSKTGPVLSLEHRPVRPHCISLALSVSTQSRSSSAFPSFLHSSPPFAFGLCLCQGPWRVHRRDCFVMPVLSFVSAQPN